MQCAGDGSGRHRQYIHGCPQCLQPLFHFDAKPLLFVDNDESQIKEVDVGRRQTMRPNHDVDFPRLQAVQNLPALLAEDKNG